MAVIETKYSAGDVVFHATTATERKQHPCPDCKGTRKWTATSPAGNEYSFECPRCGSGYRRNNDLSLEYMAHTPHVRRLTIGSVQFNSAPGAYDSGARYMCVETGVGSGSIYNEADLYDDEATALQVAQVRASEADKTVEWVAKLYDKTLEISDYQLENAALKQASEARLRAQSMLYGLSDLFDTISNAESADDIKDAVEDYKKYDWARDKERAAATGEEA